MQEFVKYQGTGNDFVLIDNRDHNFKKDTKNVKFLCDRKFGVGADGLILLEKPEHPEDDFKMLYFNADGRQSSMCGNGGRCIVDFAHNLGLFETSCQFEAIDGKHKARFGSTSISLKMNDVRRIIKSENSIVLNTGSPHYVEFVDDLDSLDVENRGATVRYSAAYADNGINVNFVKVGENGIAVRTYERGVEAETLSCGTGVTASAIATHAAGKLDQHSIPVTTRGGDLSVAFTEDSGSYAAVELVGPATEVFKGEMACKL